MAYNIKSSGSKGRLLYLPQTGKLKSGKAIEFDHYKPEDVDQLYRIFKKIVDDGQTYPQETMDSVDEFKSYYLTHEAFVVRDAEPGPDNGKVLGAFYVKPNFPGRSSHICNAGFIVDDSARGQGVATYMVPRFLRVARDLGYQASFFNLVYVSNTASIRLWDSFGFKRIGIIPRAGNLKGLGYVDAIQYYYDLSKMPKSILDYFSNNN